MTAKQQLTFLATIVILLTSCSSKQIREEKFANGTPKEKYEVSEKKDGSFLKDGYFKQWFENGQLSVSGEYEDNKETGKWTSYYEDGKIEEEGRYEKGQQVGVWKQFAANGQILRELNFKAGQFNGLQKRWYSGGQKKSEGNFETGKENGTVTTWNEDGTIKTIYTFEHGNNISLVGTWKNSVDKTFTFNKDGTFDGYSGDDPENKFKGTYSINGDSWNFNGAINEILYMTKDEYKTRWPDDGSIFTGKRLK